MPMKPARPTTLPPMMAVGREAPAELEDEAAEALEEEPEVVEVEVLVVEPVEVVVLLVNLPVVEAVLLE